MQSFKKIKVGLEQPKIRLDIFLSEKLAETRSQIKSLIENDLVLVNGKLPKKPGDQIKGGDVIEFNKQEKEKKENPEIDSESEKLEQKLFSEIKIVTETDDYVVVEKPAGVLSHPTLAKEKNTLTDFLVKKYPEIKKVGEGPDRPGIVHRLDREASGLLVVARNQKTFEHLKKQFQDRSIEKEYTVLVYENFSDGHGFIDFAIDRGPDGRMVARPIVKEVTLKTVRNIQPGREALTEYWVEETIGRFTLLKVKIHTGRMHQIRVHMFAFNHPVIGDTLYCNRKLIKKHEPKLNRLFLHSAKLCFVDLTGEKKCFISDLPEELKTYLEKIK